MAYLQLVCLDTGTIEAHTMSRQFSALMPEEVDQFAGFLQRLAWLDNVVIWCLTQVPIQQKQVTEKDGKPNEDAKALHSVAKEWVEGALVRMATTLQQLESWAGVG